MLKEGRTYSWTREITAEDISRFAELSGDKGVHHLHKDEHGRLLAHGLLVATLPTKLGGDLDYMARTMTFNFLKPVYSGDTLTCAGTIEKALHKQGRIKTAFSFEVLNQDGERVLTGTSSGLIFTQK